VDDKIGKQLFDEDDKKYIDSGDCWFEKNMWLKHHLSEKLKQPSQREEFHKWIVNGWGRIRSFKSFEMYEPFFTHLGRRLLDDEQFDHISSLSKIASFEHLKEYFIYDSRIATTLNWILLNSKANAKRFSPIPEGRNSDWKKYNMNTIIALIHGENVPYYEKEETYILYCKLIKKIYDEHKKTIKEPVYIEMLLFALFDDTIQKIQKNVKIEIYEETRFSKAL
jgi:hypothetical protein